jgi:hypothetical protein
MARWDERNDFLRGLNVPLRNDTSLVFTELLELIGKYQVDASSQNTIDLFWR